MQNMAKLLRVIIQSFCALKFLIIRYHLFQFNVLHAFPEGIYTIDKSSPYWQIVCMLMDVTNIPYYVHTRNLTWSTLAKQIKRTFSPKTTRVNRISTLQNQYPYWEVIHNGDTHSVMKWIGRNQIFQHRKTIYTDIHMSWGHIVRHEMWKKGPEERSFLLNLSQEKAYVNPNSN